MTTEEKRKALKRHCAGRTCKRCALGTVSGACWDFKADVDRNYALVFGGEEAAPVTDTDAVNHPAHYQGKYECIDEMIALFGVEAVKAFCKCNVYKYRYRAKAKNGDEDIAKAEWYMGKLMELEGMTGD